MAPQGWRRRWRHHQCDRSGRAGRHLSRAHWSEREAGPVRSPRCHLVSWGPADWSAGECLGRRLPRWGEVSAAWWRRLGLLARGLVERAASGARCQCGREGRSSVKGGPGEVVGEEVRHRGGRGGLRFREGGPAERAVVGTCEAVAMRVPCCSVSARQRSRAGRERRRSQIESRSGVCEGALVA